MCNNMAILKINMNKEKIILKGEVPVQIVKENGGYSAICYQLNLASQGDTVEEAKQMFSEALVLFIEDLYESGNLESVLLESGFNVEIKQDGSMFKIIVPPEVLNTTIKLPDFA